MTMKTFVINLKSAEAIAVNVEDIVSMGFSDDGVVAETIVEEPKIEDVVIEGADNTLTEQMPEGTDVVEEEVTDNEPIVGRANEGVSIIEELVDLVTNESDETPTVSDGTPAVLDAGEQTTTVTQQTAEEPKNEPVVDTGFTIV